jgi:D-alanine-D-alanine ligase
MNIVVLAGGLSPERDVSFCSGSLIANALMENGHCVLLLDLYLGTEIPSTPDKLFRSHTEGRSYEYIVPKTEPDLVSLKQESGNGNALIGKNVIELCRYADKVFLALHGSVGENGQLQALLDMYGISYTGTGYIGSLLAMDKDLSKILMKSADIQTPDWEVKDITCKEFNMNSITLPCVIKPCSCGSSVGVSIVNTKQELQIALDYARIYEPRVIFEQLIVGREFSIGILNGEALPPIEIIPKVGFYDYANKYQAGMTSEICPAQLEDSICQAMQTTAKKIHNILHLGFYSRIDFILNDKNEFYCLEANTLPGMTPTSLLPQEAAAAGITFHQLCELLLESNS